MYHELIDARLYFVSIFVGLLTGLIAVPYHYLLQFFFNLAITSMKGCLYATLPLITPRVCGIPPPVINGIFFTSQTLSVSLSGY